LEGGVKISRYHFPDGTGWRVSFLRRKYAVIPLARWIRAFGIVKYLAGDGYMIYAFGLGLYVGELTV